MPKTPCIVRRCPNLAVRIGRCAEHARERERETHQTGRLEPKSGRMSPQSGRMYGLRRWTLLRRRVLHDEPLCRQCTAEGRDTLASDVDHIVPIEQGGDPWARDNLQPLCASCHSAKTWREGHARTGIGSR